LGELPGQAQLRPAQSGRVWHPVVVDFEGPPVWENGDAPNPFLDFRLLVTFEGPAGTRYFVPGFLNGESEEPNGVSQWRVRFTPDCDGQWTYRASFRSGRSIAVDLDPNAGAPVAFDGAEGVIDVASRDSAAPGFHKWGRLEYVGGHYLKFRDGPYWIRGGVDSPENLLAYAGFDNTPASHHFRDHVADWRPGDPDWDDGKGRGIVGAINYLAEQRVNSIYFLTMNIGGDGGDVWPWIGRPVAKGSPENDNLHFDISKLNQWETVFAHAQSRGLFLHFVLNEAEQANKRELDDGDLGVERKLYYRELVARFGHHLALEWNLCEEYNLGFDLGPARLRAMADYLRAVDPYDHPIAVHSAGDPLEELRFIFGDPRFSLTSIQLNQRPADRITEAFRQATAAAGRPLPVSLDEFTVDRGQPASHLPIDDAAGHRKEKLWPTYLSGGMIEFILQDLLETDSFKTPQRQLMWRYMAHARAFVEENLPFHQMQPADHLMSHAATLRVPQGKAGTYQLGAQVFAKHGVVYAIYLPSAARTGTLELTDVDGSFVLRWYDPREGRFRSGARVVKGGQHVPLGDPPDQPSEDWVVLLKKRGSS
jgi:hypothetical protein